MALGSYVALARTGGKPMASSPVESKAEELSSAQQFKTGEGGDNLAR